MTRRYNSVIIKEERWYVARCLELPVTSQGKTIEEAQENLKEAVDLWIESFGCADFPPVEGAMVILYPFEVAVDA